jgi:hypothetical protein
MEYGDFLLLDLFFFFTQKASYISKCSFKFWITDNSDYGWSHV